MSSLIHLFPISEKILFEIFKLLESKSSLICHCTFNHLLFTYSSAPISPLRDAHAISVSRSKSSPGNFDSSIDRPMRLAEIYVAAEHALRKTISNEDLWKFLSSIEAFEVFNLEDPKCLSLCASVQVFLFNLEEVFLNLVSCKL